MQSIADSFWALLKFRSKSLLSVFWLAECKLWIGNKHEFLSLIYSFIEVNNLNYDFKSILLFDDDDILSDSTKHCNLHFIWPGRFTDSKFFTMEKFQV